MRKTLAALLVTGFLLPAASARAQGLTLGLRVGWAQPFGDALENVTTGAAVPLDDQFTRAIPLVVEAGYRLPSGLTLGAYFQYAFANVADDAFAGTCSEPGAECDSGRVTRFGLQALYHFQTIRPFTPWIGYGAGYEWASADGSTPEGSGTLTLKGWEYANLQVGGDYELAPKWFVGPYLSWSWGRYDDLQIESEGASVTMELGEKRFHSWLQLGVRGRFDL